MENIAFAKLVGATNPNQQKSPSFNPRTAQVPAGGVGALGAKLLTRTAIAQAMINAVTNAPAYIRGIEPVAAALMSASVLPCRDTHRRENIAGEYQSPPSAKITIAATSTAR